VLSRWYSGFVGWSSLVRLRHVTSGLYLAVIGDENGRKSDSFKQAQTY